MPSEPFACQKVVPLDCTIREVKNKLKTLLASYLKCLLIILELSI